MKEELFKELVESVKEGGRLLKEVNMGKKIKGYQLKPESIIVFIDGIPAATVYDDVVDIASGLEMNKEEFEDLAKGILDALEKVSLETE